MSKTLRTRIYFDEPWDLTITDDLSVPEGVVIKGPFSRPRGLKNTKGMGGIVPVASYLNFTIGEPLAVGLLASFLYDLFKKYGVRIIRIERTPTRVEKVEIRQTLVEVLQISESPPQRLRDLAEYIRIFPFCAELLDDRLRSAARCLDLAIQSGAFGEAEYEAFRVAFCQRINNYDPDDDWPEFNEHIVLDRENPPDALIAAWGEATWWLRDRPDEKGDIWATFEEDSDLIARLIDIEAVQQMTRAQYQDYCKAQGRTDVAENNRLYWREVEAAIQSGKPVPANVLAEYKWIKDAK